MSQTVVITGANRGIGLAFCTLYAARGDKVFAICRQASSELTALGVTVIDNIDLNNANALATVMEKLANVTIDVLINNAGILRDESLAEMNFSTIQEQFQTNAVAPLQLTHALLANLVAGSKVALITSRMGSIADNTSGGRYGYRMSKAALNAAGMSLAQDLREEQIAVGIYHPGYVQTGMVNFSGDISAMEAANRLTQLIDQLTLAETGVFKHSNGQVLPW